MSESHTSPANIANENESRLNTSKLNVNVNTDNDKSPTSETKIESTTNQNETDLTVIPNDTILTSSPSNSSVSTNRDYDKFTGQRRPVMGRGTVDLNSPSKKSRQPQMRSSFKSPDVASQPVSSLQLSAQAPSAQQLPQLPPRTPAVQARRLSIRNSQILTNNNNKDQTLTSFPTNCYKSKYVSLCNYVIQLHRRLESYDDDKQQEREERQERQLRTQNTDATEQSPSDNTPVVEFDGDSIVSHISGGEHDPLMSLITSMHSLASSCSIVPSPVTSQNLKLPDNVIDKISEIVFPLAKHSDIIAEVAEDRSSVPAPVPVASAVPTPDNAGRVANMNNNRSNLMNGTPRRERAPSSERAPRVPRRSVSAQHGSIAMQAMLNKPGQSVSQQQLQQQAQQLQQQIQQQQHARRSVSRQRGFVSPAAQSFTEISTIGNVDDLADDLNALGLEDKTADHLISALDIDEHEIEEDGTPQIHLLPLLDDSPMYRFAIAAHGNTNTTLHNRINKVTDRLLQFTKTLQLLAKHASDVGTSLQKEWGEVDSVYTLLLSQLQSKKTMNEQNNNDNNANNMSSLEIAASTINLCPSMETMGSLFDHVSTLLTQLSTIVQTTATQPMLSQRHVQTKLLKDAMERYDLRTQEYESCLDRFLARKANYPFDDTPVGGNAGSFEMDVTQSYSMASVGVASYEVVPNSNPYVASTPGPTASTPMAVPPILNTPIVTVEQINSTMVHPIHRSFLSEDKLDHFTGNNVSRDSRDQYPRVSPTATPNNPTMDIIGFGSGGVVNMGRNSLVNSVSTSQIQPTPVSHTNTNNTNALTNSSLDDRQMLCVTRKNMEEAKADLVLLLNKFRSIDRVHLIENMTETVTAFKSFFTEGNTIVSEQSYYLNSYTKLLTTHYKQSIAYEKHILSLKHQVAKCLSPMLPPKTVVDFPLGVIYNDNSPDHQIILPGLGDEIILKSGYLRKQASNISKEWQKRFFVLTNTALYYYRTSTSLVPHHVLDIVLCGVKLPSNKAKIDLECMFELISPNKRYYVLQAPSDGERDSWMYALQNGIAKGLSQLPPREKSEKSKSQSVSANPPPASEMALEPEYDPYLVKYKKRKPDLNAMQMMMALHKISPTCADCNTPNPEWACINHGILVCIVCSGIHRSLGVHVSKVRSIALDMVEPEVFEFMSSVGNAAFNSVLEASIPSNVSKPTPASSHDERDDFIQLKYVKKAFLSPTILEKFEMTSDQLQQGLLLASLYGDLKAMVQLILVGATPTGLNPSPVIVALNPHFNPDIPQNHDNARLIFVSEKKTLPPNAMIIVQLGLPITPVHLCAMSGDANCLEYLLQNTNDGWVIYDGQGMSPADRAAQVHNQRASSRLNRKM